MIDQFGISASVEQDRAILEQRLPYFPFSSLKVGNPMDSQSRANLTLVDALNLAFSTQRVNVNQDTGRLQRAYALALSALNGFGDYEIQAKGTHYATRRAHYHVVKFHKATGHQDAIYNINLQKELACSCPDTQERGQINCKHVVGVVLWQMAHDIYGQYVRETI